MLCERTALSVHGRGVTVVVVVVVVGSPPKRPPRPNAVEDRHRTPNSTSIVRGAAQNVLGLCKAPRARGAAAAGRGAAGIVLAERGAGHSVVQPGAPDLRRPCA